MEGGDPGEVALINKADYPAIPYTAHKIDAVRIGGLELSGEAVLWASRGESVWERMAGSLGI